MAKKKTTYRQKFSDYNQAQIDKMLTASYWQLAVQSGITGVLFSLLILAIDKLTGFEENAGSYVWRAVLFAVVMFALTIMQRNYLLRKQSKGKK